MDLALSNLGLRGGRRNTLGAALEFDFRGYSMPAELAALARTGPATMWQDDGKMGWGPCNLQTYSDVQSGWTARGTATITTGQADPWDGISASLISGLGVAPTNDIYRETLAGPIAAVLPITATVWIRRVSANGTINYRHSTAESSGQWFIDLSLLSDEWERITESHPAVTRQYAWATRSDGALGTQLGAQTGAPLSFYISRVQHQLGYTDFGDLPATTSTGVYLPRQHLHPVLGVRGLLAEPAATNYYLNSNWVGGTTPTDWLTMVPAGGSITPTASLLGNADGAVALVFTAAAVSVFAYQTVVPAANETCTINVQIEAVTALACGSVMYPNSMPPGCNIIAWRLNGVIVTDATPAAVGTLSVTVGGTYASSWLTARIGVGCNGATTGSATLSRPQFERGSEVPTSYVPSPTGAAAARTADPFAYTLPSALATALSTAGTVLADFCYDGAGSSVCIARVSAPLYTSHMQRLLLYNPYGLRDGAYMENSGPALSILGGSAVNANVRVRSAVGYQTNRLAISTDGGATSVSVGSCAAPPVVALGIGSTYAAALGLAGTLFRIRVWDRVLSDAELQAVTA
jgi:hypothetical protein